jgi:DNA-binding beta-propeller fold protein YncE
MDKRGFSMNTRYLSFFVILLVFLSSCATGPKTAKQPPVFYPGPPDPPRIQFLKSFTKASDIEAPKSAFTSFVTGEKERSLMLDKPYGIAAYQGKIYVCDTNAAVLVFDLEKKTLTPLQGAQGLGKLVQPLNISIDKDGNKYVTDTVRKQVVVFDRNDFYVRAFGPVEDWKPVDAAVYEGRLYVADIKNSEIKVFDLQSGELQSSFGRKGTEDSKLGMPTNIAFDSNGYLYVSDAGRFQVVNLDRDGNGRGVIGSLGRHPGAFSRPKGLALDRQNRLYVVDTAFNNVQVFSADGQLLLFFSKGGNGPGELYLAAKVAIDYDNVKYFQQYAEPNFQIEYLILVTSQFGDHKVNVYGFGAEKGKIYKTDEELKKDAEEKKLKEKRRSLKPRTNNTMTP